MAGSTSDLLKLLSQLNVTPGLWSVETQRCGVGDDDGGGVGDGDDGAECDSWSLVGGNPKV